jgi:tetratricopeptide (TPR) repeat protein
VLVGLGRHAEAARAFTRYLHAGGPPAAPVYRWRAVARLEQGDAHGAVDDFTMALGLEPGDAALWLQRGQAHLRAQSGPAALRDFEHALKIDPGNAQARLGLGLARLKVGRPHEAVADAEMAARLAPGDARLAYDAACLVAQAARLTGAGPGAGPRQRDRRGLYFEKSAWLLRQALEQTPAEGRADFWAGTVRVESALGPLRATEAWGRLERKYGRPGT